MAQRPQLKRQYTIAAQKTIVLVSGANSGIGYEIAKKIAVENPNTHHVLLGCRDTSKGEQAVSSMGAPTNVNPIPLDVTSDESIDYCFKAIEQIFGRLDILINNAGTAGTFFPKDTTVRQRYTDIYNVNVIGTACLTEKMTPLLSLSKLPKIIFITSTLGSIGSLIDGSSPLVPVPPYNSSKAAINYLTAYYAKKYPEWKVNCSCPGHRATGLNSLEKSDETDPAKGATNAVRLVMEGTDGATGTYTNTDRTIPW